MRKSIAILLLALALVSCAKKIPPAEPFDAEKSFNLANALLEKKKWEEARRELYDIKRREADLRYAPLAQLRLADSYLMEEEPESAIDEYRRFLKDYPSHKYASYAQYRIATIYFSLIKDHERGFGAAVRALDEFEALNGIYPRHPYREEVAPLIDRCKDVIARHEFMVGGFYLRRDAWRGALDRFLELHEKFPDFRVPDVLLNIALSYKGLGEKEKAEEYASLLIGRHPESAAAKKASREFGR